MEQPDLFFVDSLTKDKAEWQRRQNYFHSAGKIYVFYLYLSSLIIILSSPSIVLH